MRARLRTARRSTDSHRAETRAGILGEYRHAPGSDTWGAVLCVHRINYMSDEVKNMVAWITSHVTVTPAGPGRPAPRPPARRRRRTDDRVAVGPSPPSGVNLDRARAPRPGRAGGAQHSHPRPGPCRNASRNPNGFSYRTIEPWPRQLDRKLDRNSTGTRQDRPRQLDKA